MRIRAYTPSDLAGIRWLHDRTPPAGQVSARPQRWPAGLDEIEANFAAFFVAIEPQGDEEVIVGMAGIQPVHGAEPDLMGVPVPEELIVNAPTVRLEAVRVAPERQRRGIGRALTRIAIQWAEVHGFERMLLDTTSEQEAAIALYESEGFRRIGTSEFGRWQIVWMALDM
jgi:ribosomal protein S18 acetylase RimI-like enzyme